MLKLTLLATALVLVALPAHAENFCTFYDRAENLAGRVITVRGAYSWENHSQYVLPEGCESDKEIFVSLTGRAADTISAFLWSAYPGVTFGGGTVWGSFTGTVVVPTEGSPYLSVSSVDVDKDKRMKFAKP